jgi:hypothetical protein
MTRPETLSAPDQAARPAHRLALAAAVGPVLFTITWIVLGYLSTGYTLFDHQFTGYSPISQPISGLGMGTTAPYMNSAFIIGGLALVTGVFGVFRSIGGTGRLRRSAFLLLACTGIGQVMCGVFNLEAVMLHTLGFLLAIGTPVVSFLVAGTYLRRLPAWRRFGTWLLVGSPLTLILLVAFFLTFQPTADGAEHGVAGLVQRVAVLEVQGWFVAMGWKAFRRRDDQRPG